MMGGTPVIPDRAGDSGGNGNGPAGPAMEPRRDHREVDGSAVVDDRQAGGIDVAAVVGVGGTDDHRHGAIIRAGDPDAGILQGFEQPVLAQSDDRALPLDCRDMVGTGDGGLDHVLVG